MKIQLLSLIMTLAGISGFSQKQFEGTIIYKLHSNEDKKGDGQLTIVFGKHAIRLKMEDKNSPDNEELLIRIDSGKIYTVNKEKKTSRSRKLIEKEKNEPNLAGKKIAGFTSSAFDLSGGNSFGALAGRLFRGGNAVFYVADSLFYSVPEKYSSNVEFVFLHDGRIALGVDLKLGRYGPRYDDEEEDEKMNGSRMTITAEAISVKWETFNENEFSIPADFVKYKYNPLTDDAARIADSMEKITIDTTSAPHTKPVKKSPAKPKTKTTTTKTGAIRKPE